MSAKPIHALVITAFLGSMAGCATFLIEGAGDRDKSVDTPKVEETVHGSFWGIEWDKPAVSKCEKDHELYRVKVHQNALFLFASVVTLGLYVPQSVEWWCVPRTAPAGDEGPSLNLKKKTPG
jgi:hypothetical protein